MWLDPSGWRNVAPRVLCKNALHLHAPTAAPTRVIQPLVMQASLSGYGLGHLQGKWREMGGHQEAECGVGLDDG